MAGSTSFLRSGLHVGNEQPGSKVPGSKAKIQMQAVLAISEKGKKRPALAMITMRPAVFRATVLPPVFGPAAQAWWRCILKNTSASCTCAAFKRGNVQVGDHELYGWHKESIDHIRRQPDPRKVRWYADYKGNSGKSYKARVVAQDLNLILPEQLKIRPRKYAREDKGSCPQGAARGCSRPHSTGDQAGKEKLRRQRKFSLHQLRKGRHIGSEEP
eukprot:1143560-Pelagomonas_calceolata.AAC.3